MNNERFEQARLSRDPRFDGRFFIAVSTTMIYCRPVCPVKMPKSKNVTFYLTAAAASEAGYRPCLRCRPESSPGTPAWLGTRTTVNRALGLISEGALDTSSVEALSDRLGVTSRHLSRLFSQFLGASPKSVAQTRRLHFAKKLIDETSLPMIDIALAAGYSSVRRFNDHFKVVYKRTPTSIRKKTNLEQGSGFLLRLSYRPPFDYAGVLKFLKVRAIPGVEHVSDQAYARCFVIDGQQGDVNITHDEPNRSLLVRINIDDTHLLRKVLDRVISLFDLNADPEEIHNHLRKDEGIAGLVDENPGQRVPGCWDTFEIMVRAIVGQQVSVKGATTVMGRIATIYGVETAAGLYFPDPEALVGLDISKLSMPKKRAQTIKDMSQALLDGDLRIDRYMQPETLIEQLVSIKGIGNWTAQYITMRAISDPNAFLVGDLVLRKVAKQLLGLSSDQDLETHAARWQPWRAYAGMHLWRHAAAAIYTPAAALHTPAAVIDHTAAALHTPAAVIDHTAAALHTPAAALTPALDILNEKQT